MPRETIGLAAFVLIACASTPPPPPPPTPTPVIVASDAPAIDIGAIIGATWHAEDAASPWYASYTFDSDRYTTSGYPSYQESGNVALVRVDGRRMLLRLSDRIFDGTADETIELWIELAEDGESFTLLGDRYVKRERSVTVAKEEG